MTICPQNSIGRYLASFVLLASLIIWSPSGKGVAAGTAVDLELAIAVDTSASVDNAEYNLQMEGLVRAFRDPAVIAAIQATGPSGIAVTLYHWSSANEQAQIVPWTQITDAASSHAFAGAISSNYGRRFTDSTGIGEALKAGARLIRGNRFLGRRKSIDVSGDGRNNSGIPPHITRKEVLAEGVTINGLAILNDDPFLHHYYAREVIGGPAAFVMTVASYDDIVKGMRNKLLREISISIADAVRPGANPAE